MTTEDPKHRYASAEADRRRFVDAVVNSAAQKKIVVAGPGTGKTHLFKRILQNKKKAPTLTFVNSLVEDLSLELYGLSDVKTLHGYARGLLSQLTGSAKVFPKLSEAIGEDAKIVLGRAIDFDKLFHDRDDNNPDVKFYSARRKYYDNFYGYTDVVFAAVKYLEGHLDKIPAYEQVLVDEFQDFNQLEVSLIDLLAGKSSILLAGDDDQALYDFKSASAKHIRDRHSDANVNYESFSLPYCSRCTRVIVDAINDVLAGATAAGCLAGRINKSYRYFDCETKDEESAKHPSIVYRQLYSKQIPWFIESQIDKIASERRSKFSALVISPTSLQARTIAEALRGKGFENVAYVDRSDRGISIVDGLKLLTENGKSNLGWRIVTKFVMSKKDWELRLETSLGEGAKAFRELIDTDVRAKITKLVAVLRHIENDETFDAEIFHEICKKSGIDSVEAAKEALKALAARNVQRGGKPAIRKIPIQTTTIQSSKGLAEDYVFITHFDDQYFIRDGQAIADREVCNFLVALTRARRKVFLISSTKKEPTFLRWIAPERISAGV
jgi:superfamily I DNA/RNA helicase